MNFSDIALSELKNKVSLRLSSKRYSHTLRVEKIAKKLAEIFLPDLVGEIRAAALLHDIAKELTDEENSSLIKEYKISVSEESMNTEPALHSFAAVAVIKRDFPVYATENILSAVYNHTLGSPSMSLFDEIIFIADYIEEGRTFESCTKVREELFEELASMKSNEERIISLHKSVVKSLDYIISHLISKKFAIDSTTVKTRNAFLALI